MTWKRAVARCVAASAMLGKCFLGDRCGFRILLYHAVGSWLDHDTYGLSIRPQLFEHHMAMLAERQSWDVVDIWEGRTRRSPLRIAVTFDDGYKDVLEVAAPILLKHQIPFAVFVTSAFIESQSPPYLTRSQLSELANLPGVTIGSHGVTHVRLADCDERTLWRELHDSRRYLEDAVGRPVRAISYPHGSVNRRVVDAARRVGYVIGMCSRFDINDDSREPLLLCRTELVAGDSERVFRQKLCGAWDWHRWRHRDPASL